MSNTKTRFSFLILLILSLCLSVFMFIGNPITASAADEPHAHTGYTAWSDASSMPTSGSYYLTTDVTTGSITITEDIDICLNGHTVTVNGTIEVNGDKQDGTDAVFNIYDCNGEGKIKSGNADRASIIYLFQDASLNMYGGTLDGSNKNNCVNVYVNNTFNMYGGIITNGRYANGGGISVRGHFNMYDGLITGNLAQSDVGDAGDPVANGGGVFVGLYGQIKIYGGKITNNTAAIADGLSGTSKGGGICFDGYNDIWESFIYGGEISGNSADLGGGIYANMASVKIGLPTTDYEVTSYPLIKGNTARQSGGGAYGVNRGYISFTNTVIENNTALAGNGGAVYYNVDELLLKDVTIRNNTASNANGGGVNTMSAELSGLVVIKDNSTLEGAAANLTVYNDVTVLDSLSPDSEIGVVITRVLRVDTEEATLIGASDTDYSSIFVSDSPLCELTRNDDNSIQFGYIHRDHKWASVHSHDSTSHWYACVCDYEDCHLIKGSPSKVLMKGYESHVGGSGATCSTLKECDVCGSPYGIYNTNVHESTEEKWIPLGNGKHCKGLACCGAVTDSFEWSCYGTSTPTCAYGSLCDDCGEPYGDVLSGNHRRGEIAVSEGDTHYFTCDWCGIRMEEREHAWGLWIKGDGVTHTRTCIFCPETAEAACEGAGCTSCVESEEHTHLACGETACTHGGNAHSTDIVYKPITQENIMSILVHDFLRNYYLPFGNYYLAEDITLSKMSMNTPKDTGNINLCFAGKKLTINDSTVTVSVSVRQRGEYNISDCSTDQSGMFEVTYDSTYSAMLISVGTELTVYGGTFSAIQNSADSLIFNVNDANSRFRLYRAHLKGSTGDYTVCGVSCTSAALIELHDMTTDLQHTAAGKAYDISWRSNCPVKLYGTSSYSIEQTYTSGANDYSQTKIDLSEYSGTITLTIEASDTHIAHNRLLFLGDASRVVITNEDWGAAKLENDEKQYVRLVHTAHTGGTAYCGKLAECSLCGEEYGEYAPDNHVVDETKWYSISATYHMRHCLYCDVTLSAPKYHTLVEGSELTWYVKQGSDEDPYYIIHYSFTCTDCGLAEEAAGSIVMPSDLDEDAQLKDAATCSTAAVYLFTSEKNAGESMHSFTWELPGIEYDYTNHAAGATTHLLTNSDGTHSIVCDACDHAVTSEGCVFDQSVADDKYIKEEANCIQKALYYKSCACGHKGTESFEYGEPDTTKHDWNDTDVCSRCSAVKITEKTFPDEKFRNFILGEFLSPLNEDEIFTLEELSQVKRIAVFDVDYICDLTGIEYFTELTTLECHGFHCLKPVDLSKNTKLTEVYFGLQLWHITIAPDATFDLNTLGIDLSLLTLPDGCTANNGVIKLEAGEYRINGLTYPSGYKDVLFDVDIIVENPHSHASVEAFDDCTKEELCLCGEITKAATEHDFSGSYLFDDDGHWHKCVKCAVSDAKIAHTGGTATCTAKAVCTVCGTAYGELNANNHSKTTFVYTANADGTTHTKKYECCGAVAADTEAHSYQEDNKCVCGAEKSEAPVAVIVTAVTASVALLGGGGFALWWFVFRKKK